MNAIYIITSFALAREDYCLDSLDFAAVRIQMNRYLRSRDLVVTIVTYRAAGQHDSMIDLVEHPVVGGAPSQPLADPNIAVRKHLLHVMEVFAIFYVKRIAQQHAIRLDRMHMPAKKHQILLIIERQRIRLDVYGAALRVSECAERRAA